MAKGKTNKKGAAIAEKDEVESTRTGSKEGTMQDSPCEGAGETYLPEGLVPPEEQDDYEEEEPRSPGLPEDSPGQTASSSARPKASLSDSSGGAYAPRGASSSPTRSATADSPKSPTEEVRDAFRSPPPEEHNPEPLSESVAMLGRSSSGGYKASADMHENRRIMGAAAAIGGATGMLLAGPVAATALGVGAAYATTREDSAGTVSRKAGAVYLQVADRAVDEGIKAMDQAVDAGCKRLADKIDRAQVPNHLKNQLRALTMQQPTPVRKENLSANIQESKRILERYPDRVPIICERSPNAQLPDLNKKKFIVPGAMLCGEFKYILHKQIVQATAGGLQAEQTIYIFVNGIAPKTSTPLSELYDQLQSSDGFLYIRYGAENTLG